MNDASEVRAPYLTFKRNATLHGNHGSTQHSSMKALDTGVVL